MWKSKWILFLFLLIVIAPTLCLAQSSLQRLEEFGSRSLIFDVPSVVHFDITIIQDSPKSGLSLRKVTGRFVQGERLGFRIDLKEMGDTESGREWEREHFLSMPNGEKFRAFERPSVGFNSVVVDTALYKGVNTMVSRGNPFRYVINGSQSLHSNPETDIFAAIKRNFEEVDTEGILRHKAGPSVFQIEFDKETTWQINRLRAFIPQDAKQLTLMRKNRTKLESVKDLKNWLCARDLRAKWRDVDGAGLVPYWIHSVEEGLQGNDPKFAEQMEAFFFGFQFDNIPLEKYFDKSRFTEAFLKEDFNLQEIEQLKKRDIKE
jgi:hypothetical protein